KLVISDGLQLSNIVTQNVGVLQGDSLSPLLFVLYTGDLIEQLRPSNSESTRIYAFADDTAASAKTPAELQTVCNKLSDWCLANGLAVNPAKTKVLKFRRGGRFGAADKIAYR